MPEECNSKYRVLQYLMRASLFIQPQIEKCLIHHQAANLDSCRLSVLIQNEGIRLIKHRQIQTFQLKKLALIFFLIKVISIMLKYKGSWPSLGFHGVIFVYICQTLTEFFFILITGKMSYCPNSTTYFSIMHFHLLLGKQKEPKAIQEPMKN